MAESGRIEGSASNKPTNSLLQRIKQLEDELSNHVNSYKRWTQKIEYTLVETGIELMEPPTLVVRPDEITSASNTLKSPIETEKLETASVVVTDEDLYRDLSLDMSEESSEGFSEKSTEIGSSEIDFSGSPLNKSASPPWQKREDNSEVARILNNQSDKSQSEVPSRPEVCIPASFKPSKHSSSRSRYRRTRRLSSKPKAKGIPKKSSVAADRELVVSCAFANMSQGQIKYDNLRQEEQEANELLSVSGSGYSKLYRCNVCGFTDQKKPGAVAHARFTHGKGRIHPCSICSYKFKNTWDVQHHINRSHSEVVLPSASFSGRVGETNQKWTLVSSLKQKKSNKSLEKKRAVHVYPTANMRSQKVLNSEIDKTYMSYMENDERIHMCLSCQLKTHEELVMRTHVLCHKCPFCPLSFPETAMLEDHKILCRANGRRQSGTYEKTQEPQAAKSRAVTYVRNSLE